MNWKRVERAVAARLGGRRVGSTGGATPDVTTAWCSVEVKSRRRLPRWLVDAMHQAVRNASGETLPLLILHEHGCSHDDDFVVLRLGDFQDWFGAYDDPRRQRKEVSR